MALLFGEFSFRADTRQLMRGEAQVHVSPKAFRLLELLLSRRPGAVSKKELYESLWGELFVEEANLPNLIHEIRTALSDRSGAVIRTVPRFGYAFAASVRDSDESRSCPFRLVAGTLTHDLTEGETIIGRDAGATFQLIRPGISRRHARLSVTSDEVVIEDLGSKNGTFLEGQRIDRPHSLHGGEEFWLASVRIVLQRIELSSLTLTDNPFDAGRDAES